MTADTEDVMSLVEQGVYLVEAGHKTLDGLVVPDREGQDVPDLSDDELRERVREQLDDEPEDDGDDREVEGGRIDDPSDVDWPALWDEFGFRTPDAAGNALASDTQLRTAIQVSEQGINRRPGEVIRVGLEAGAIDRVTARGEGGEDHLRGYRLGGDA